MSKIGVISLGCEKNRVDTERMLGFLKEAGHTFVSREEEAEILIVNTCGFIEPAKQESIDTILELAAYKNQNCRLLIATGCLTERYGKELLEAIPEIDVLLGVREYETLPGRISQALGEERKSVPSAPGCLPPRVLTTPPYRAYLRIGDGCNNRCTYCAIPLIRGALSSEPRETLLEEARRLADGGVTELTVIAQDTSGYGRDIYGKPELIPLLKELASVESLHWIRLLYTYPDTVTPELIDLLAENEKLIPYLDMPLQHVSDEILGRMNRRGSKRHILSVMEYAERYRAEFTFRTTMMVGFPGETEEQFEEMLTFLREHPFDRVGAFAFSPEEGTEAALFPGQVPEEVKQERLDRLMRQQGEISENLNRQRIGRKTEFLAEGFLRKHRQRYVWGRSAAEAPDDADGLILIPCGEKQAEPGHYYPVRLVKAYEYDMLGEWTEE